MPNQKLIPVINSYDAGDIADIYSCTESDMQWMNTAISHIRNEIKKLNTLVLGGEAITQYHFTDLIHHIDMYEYLAENRLEYHAEEAERYAKKWEQIKGGNHNV